MVVLHYTLVAHPAQVNAELGALVARLARPHPLRLIGWLFVIFVGTGAMLGYVGLTAEPAIPDGPSATTQLVWGGGLLAVGIAGVLGCRRVLAPLAVAIHERGFVFRDRAIAWRDVARYRDLAAGTVRILSLEMTAGMPRELHAHLAQHDVIDRIIAGLAAQGVPRG